MAITVNKNTTQAPLTATGLTGSQILRLIPAPRIYMKATPDSKTAAVIPTSKSNGSTPAGWTDLGSVAGNARLLYEKQVKEVRTGLDNYLRAAYIEQKGGTLEFMLNQVDDYVLEKITGLTPSVVTASSAYTVHIGQEDLVEMALLLVVQNKLDGKELQFYHPAALVNFVFDEEGDAMVIKATAILPFFTVENQTQEDVLPCTIFV